MQTGKPLGETGLDVARSTIQSISPHQELDKMMGSIPPETVSSSARRWNLELLGKMPNQVLREYSLNSLQVGREEVEEAIANLEDLLALPSVEQCVEVFGVMAEVLQVTLPQAAALRLSARLLSEEVPAAHLEDMCHNVLKKHQWNTLPNAAECIAAAQPWVREVNAMKRNLEYTVSKMNLVIRWHTSKEETE